MRVDVKNNLDALLEERGRASGDENILASMQEAERLFPPGHHVIEGTRRRWFSRLFETGRTDEALELSREFLKTNRERFEKNAGWLSERQQLGLLNSSRGHLDNYLSAAHAARRPAAEVYAEVLAWKGAVSLRQMRQRALRIDGGDPASAREISRIQTELRSLIDRIESLYLTRNQLKKPEIEELTRRCENLDQELGRLNQGYGILQAKRLPTVAELQSALKSASPDTILVDFLEHQFLVPAADGKPARKEVRVSAFVLRADHPVVWIDDLGSPDRIAAAVDDWRRWLSEGGLGTWSGLELKKLIWDPLEKHVASAKVVLTSADGAIAKVPFAALPGRTSNKFLIHDHMFAVIPSSATLPEMLSKQAGFATTADTPDSLLLVGDIDYGTTDKPDPSRKGIFQLEHSAAEIQAVGNEFRVARAK
jgi:hypothetical protein